MNPLEQVNKCQNYIMFIKLFGGLPGVQIGCRIARWKGILSLLSNPTRIFQFGVHFPCQKSNLPRLVKMCQMRLPQGRVLLQSTFECLPQLQIELMIAHWKYICV
jgi:hypothetical protein